MVGRGTREVRDWRCLPMKRSECFIKIERGRGTIGKGDVIGGGGKGLEGEGLGVGEEVKR